MREPLKALSGRGSCHWTDCPSEADYTIQDVKVRPPTFGKEVDVGDVELCGGHYKIAMSLGRLDLEWDRVLKAMDPDSDEGCEDCGQ